MTQCNGEINNVERRLAYLKVAALFHEIPFFGDLNERGRREKSSRDETMDVGGCLHGRPVGVRNTPGCLLGEKDTQQNEKRGGGGEEARERRDTREDIGE